MNKRLLTLTLVMISLAGFSQKAHYTASLQKVETPSKLKMDPGIISIDSVSNRDNFKYTYKDKVINITWYKGITEFYFELTNATDETIRIIWNEASYIGPDGVANKVFHNGVKYIDRNNEQLPVTLIKGAKIKDIIAPTDNVYYTSGSYGGWRQRDLFKNPKKKDTPDFDNTTVRILLPIMTNDKVVEYIFDFKINWTEYVKKK